MYLTPFYRRCSTNARINKQDYTRLSETQIADRPRRTSFPHPLRTPFAVCDPVSEISGLSIPAFFLRVLARRHLEKIVISRASNKIRIGGQSAGFPPDKFSSSVFFFFHYHYRNLFFLFPPNGRVLFFSLLSSKLFAFPRIHRPLLFAVQVITVPFPRAPPILSSFAGDYRGQCGDA